MRAFTKLIVLLFAVAHAYTNCKWTAKGTDESFPLSATFDLSPFAGYDYTVINRQVPSPDRNYTYVFSVCGVVEEVPAPGSQNATYARCYESGGSAITHYPAYQVSSVKNECYRLGVDATAENTRWFLNDNHDPTVGITYQYINGDETGCSAGVSRSLSIELTCKDGVHTIPEVLPVYENDCQVKLSIDSTYGCPMECGTSRGMLCGKRGVCRFDMDTRKPHCYCQKGYTGYACNEKGENKAEGFTNTTLILVVVFVMLVVMEIAIILMWDKVKRLRLDPSAYTNFATADELA